MKRVLVTGATGFIGRHTLAPLAARGFDVHAITSHAVEARDPVARWHSVDLFDRHAVSALMASLRPSHLLHFAWYAEPGKFWSSPHNLSWTAASLDLLMDFVSHGGRRITAAGSCAEYADSAVDCDEHVTPCRPATLYGSCKHAFHSILEAFAPGRVSHAWGRIFHLYGPHEYPDRLVPSVILAVRDGRPALCTAGTQVRDFLHVQDVAEAFVALLDSDVEGAVNVASGVPVPVAEVVTRLGVHLGRPDLIRLGARPMPAQDAPRLTASVRRLRDEVGWQPTRDLDQGLADTVSWWAGQMPSAPDPS